MGVTSGRALSAFLLGSALVAGCSLVDLSGFSGGATSDPTDGGAEQAADAATDAHDGGEAAPTPPTLCGPSTCKARPIAPAQHGPIFLRASAGHLAWATCDGNVRVRVTATGEVAIRAGFDQIVGLAHHASELYVGTGTAIHKLGLAPGGAAPSYLGSVSGSTLVASAEGIFWAEGKDVVRCDLDGCPDGGGARTVVPTGDNIALALIADDTIVAMTKNKYSALYRVDAKGGGATLLVGVDGPSAATVASGTLWYASCSTCVLGARGTGPSIHRIALTGVGGAVTFPVTAPASGIALMGDHVFFTTRGTPANRFRDGALYRMRLDGSQETKLLSDLKHPHSLIASEGELYWASAGEHDEDELNSLLCFGTDGAIMQLVE